MTIALAPRLAEVKPSASSVISQRARALKAEGVEVIALASGEPDFPTPPHVIEAAFRAAREGATGYTNSDGTPELKAAVAEKFRRENGLDYGSNEILVGSGAKQIVWDAFTATLGPGDEVILPTPFWISYADIALLAEGVPVRVPCPQNNGFKLRPEELEAAITGRTRWLVLNAPGNPSGAVYSRAELEELAAVLRRHPHVAVLTDDIYEHIIFDGLVFHTLAAVAPDLKDRVLTVNGVSKAYAMTGWRIGYAGGPAPLIRAMANVQTQATGCPSSVSQAAALAALTGPQDFIPERSSAFQRRRDAVLAALGGVPGITAFRPQGAFYLYLGCAGLLGRTRPDGTRIETDRDVALYLLEEARVAAVQGEAYGLSPYIRISIATSDAALEEACRRIRAACETLH